MKTKHTLRKKLWIVRTVVMSLGLLFTSTVNAQWSSSSGTTTTSDKVGIGITVPDSLLHLRATNNDNNGLLKLQVLSGSLTDNAGITLWARNSGASTNARNWQISNNWNISGNLDIMRSTSNSGNPTTTVASFDLNGNLSIGTSSVTAGYRLDVNGDLKISGTGNINANGTIEAGNIKAKYQDIAEWVPASAQLSAGTVVVLDSAKSNQVIASSQAYDTRVAGVISEQPGITLGEKSAGRVLVATTGRVKVKVDATKSPIQIGDLLVTSDLPGVAMKSQAINLRGVQIHRPGTLIGKALEPLAKRRGEILVLLSLQ